MTEVVPILRVDDARAGAAFYAHLGFRVEWEHQFERGFPLFVSIATADGPDTLLYIWVAEVDDTYATLRDAAIDVAQPEDQPWGRELAVRDPDGNRLRIATRAAT